MSIESEEEVVWKALELYRAAAKEGKGHSSDRGGKKGSKQSWEMIWTNEQLEVTHA
jgi:hypothetical protein